MRLDLCTILYYDELPSIECPFPVPMDTVRFEDFVAFIRLTSRARWRKRIKGCLWYGVCGVRDMTFEVDCASYTLAMGCASFCDGQHRNDDRESHQYATR
jgi:hypothetical protein